MTLDTKTQTTALEIAAPRRKCAVTLPQTYNYIGAFLSFRCPYHCSYCINRFDGKDPRAAEISGRAWIEFFERLNPRDVPITLQGGEPGCHPDFIAIVAATLAKHHVDILSNLTFNLGKFVDCVNPRKINRTAPYAPIRVSYHPEQYALQDILKKVLFLQNNGFRVGLYGVMHPDQITVMQHAASVCADLGVDFRTKPFLGWHNNILYGQYAFPGVMAQNNNKLRRCECAPSELLIAPNGSIHRCHSFLYAGLPPLGQIGDSRLELTDDYLSCNRFGACNPCDIKIKNNRFQQFGHISARIRNIN